MSEVGVSKKCLIVCGKPEISNCLLPIAIQVSNVRVGLYAARVKGRRECFSKRFGEELQVVAQDLLDDLLRIVDAVVERKDGGPFAGDRFKRPRGEFSIVGFDAEENQVCAICTRRIVRKQRVLDV